MLSRRLADSDLLSFCNDIPAETPFTKLNTRMESLPPVGAVGEGSDHRAPSEESAGRLSTAELHDARRGHCGGSPASVWRVLGKAGLLSKWKSEPSKKGTGFEHPLPAKCIRGFSSYSGRYWPACWCRTRRRRACCSAKSLCRRARREQLAIWSRSSCRSSDRDAQFLCSLPGVPKRAIRRECRIVRPRPSASVRRIR